MFLFLVKHYCCKCDLYSNILLSSFNLKHVFYSSKLSNNLISAKNLTFDLNCYVALFFTHCVFHDLATRSTVGTIKENGDLYYFNNLETKGIFNRQTTTSCLQSYITSESSQIWLLHSRLIHASFFSKVYAPFLFSQKSMLSHLNVIYVNL